MKTFVGVPAMGTVITRFASCLRDLKEVGEVIYGWEENSLIYDARDNLSAQALNHKCDYILFIDSDMIFDPDLLIRLTATARKEKADLVTALFFTRRPPIKPSLYTEFRYEQTGEAYIPISECMFDYPKNSVFPIKGCGMAATLISCDAIRDVWEKFGTPFTPMGGFGEDFSFCMRLEQVGRTKLLCDSSVKVGHIGYFTADEGMYEAQKIMEASQNARQS